MDDIGDVFMSRENDGFDFLDDLFGEEVKEIRGSEDNREPERIESSDGKSNVEDKSLDMDKELLASLAEDEDDFMLDDIINNDSEVAIKKSVNDRADDEKKNEVDESKHRLPIQNVELPEQDVKQNVKSSGQNVESSKQNEDKGPTKENNESEKVDENPAKSKENKKKRDNVPSFIVAVDDDEDIENEDFENVESNDEDSEEEGNEYLYDEYSEDELSKLPPDIREAIEWEPPFPKSTPDLLVNEWIQTGWVGDLHIDQILTEAIITGASDVHITTDLLVSMTRNGDIVRYDGYPVPDAETMHTVIHDGLLKHQELQVLNLEYEYEGSYTLMFGPMAGRRTRLTIGQTFGNYFMVFRIISEHIPTTESLGIKQEIIDWSHYPNGLFLICGPTGSGKSTTLASVIRELQLTTQKKIITIEKPIEYVYPDDAPSIMVQREVGQDTRSFANGLTSAMRQSPNVILLGEVRNIEEVSELLRAAETGHLAISTMHTNSVATTINRIRNLFEGSEQKRIMSTLADTMRGVGNQVLVKTPDGEGRFAVNELLTINDKVKGLIVEGDVRGIRKYQIENESTMEHNLAKAVAAGKCTAEDAKGHVVDLELFNSLLSEVNVPPEDAGNANAEGISTKE